MAALVERIGAAPGAAQRLAAVLADYADEDTLVRASGAEAPAYARFGLDGPPNRALKTRWQALDALGWSSALNDAQFELLWENATATERQEGLNVNTAPALVIEAVTGDARAAATLLSRRAQGELRDIQEAQALLGGRAAGVGFATMPGTAFRIVVAFGESGAAGQRLIERSLSFSEGYAERPVLWGEEWRRRGAGALGGQSETAEPFPRGAAVGP